MHSYNPLYYLREVIVIETGGIIEVWTKLTVLCRERPEFRYHTLKKKKWPFIYKDWTFQKIPTNTKQI